MQHYMGFTHNLPQRLRAHREGDGGVTTRRAFDQGVASDRTRLHTWLEAKITNVGHFRRS
jgi:predicted GIY-YIG superfamily endonuclease